MGAYAAWFDDQPRPQRSWWDAIVTAVCHCWHLLARRFLSRRRVFLVADFEPSLEQLRERLGGAPVWLALPVQPRHTPPEVRHAVIATGTNPIDFGCSLTQAKRCGVDVVAFWLPWSEIRGQTLLHLWKNGFRWGWLLRGSYRLAVPLLFLVAWRGFLSWWQKRVSPKDEKGPAAETMLGFQALPAEVRNRAQLRIGHFIRTWMFGGVERQLALLAEMQQQAGHEVRVFLQTAPQRQLDSTLRWLPSVIRAETIAIRLEGPLLQSHLDLKQLAALPDDLRGMVLDMAGELMRHPVDVLHCWIDEANLVGLLAAQVAGIPAVAMSVLGVSPKHWPMGHKPWMRGWYRTGLQSTHLALIGISEAGIHDYADWLDLPTERLSLIRIAFPPPPLPTPEATHRVRHELGIPPDAPMVMGVFRLDPEKRPLFFVNVVKRLHELVPDVHVLHAGGGGLRGPFLAEINRLGLNGVVHPLGQPADVLTPMAASDVFLMVSEVEGTPNVSMEAQYLGCVPVLTDVGGCRETMRPGATGLVFPKDDLEGIAQGVAGLLRDPGRRQAMAQTGRAFVRECYAPATMMQETMKLYHWLLAAEGKPLRHSA
jgi:glycosyltransferase involved in cell wall biosynthesis